MSSFLLKHYRGLYLLLPVLLGISLGHLAATALGIYLSPPVTPAGELAKETPAVRKRPALGDYGIVLERNIFDYASRGTGSLAEDPTVAGTASVARPDLALVGTVTQGEGALAVIKSDKGVKTYRLGAELPGGGRLEEVTRNYVQIEYPDGSLQKLPLFDQADQPGGGTAAAAGSRRPGSAAAAGGSVRPVGDNRWVIPQEVAEKARGNLNELLKQARMEPNIVNGRTEGFVVRMVQPRSLLSELGIQRGDVLMQINGVSLDSPEKALQIFQQLREAKNISIGLTRNGSNMSFQYDVN